MIGSVIAATLATVTSPGRPIPENPRAPSSVLTHARPAASDSMTLSDEPRMPDSGLTVSALASNSAARNISRRIPLIGFAQAGGDGYFDDGGYPVGGSWDEVTLPEIGDPNAYALEVSGDSMEPVFRDGDMIIVSPSAPIRRGDRVVVRTQRGEVMTKQLARRSARRIA